MERADVAIVGAGIVGLAHAWAAARRGMRVAVFERSPRAEGASIRNFGMIWPIGQPPGPMLDLAMESRRYWLELGTLSAISVRPCGSLHLARADDEQAVLEEFAQRAPAWGYDCRLLSARETREKCPGVVPDHLRVSLYSVADCVVDPRQVLALLPRFLSERFGVTFHFSTPVNVVDDQGLRTAAGHRYQANQVIICSGHDFATLFPAAFANSGIRVCKLQMLRTPPQPAGWQLGPHIAGGLTLCHYRAFQECPSLSRLRARLEAEYPEHFRYGIHVMAAQNHLGEVLIGDSHEYGEDIEIFDKEVIDALVLAYLREMLTLPDPSIATRWHGIYAKHPSLPIFTARPGPRGSVLRVAPGGAGMTLAFALGEQWFREQE